MARSGWSGARRPVCAGRHRADALRRGWTPIQRNFVHVEDLVSAILHAIDNPKARQQTFNICMDEPVDYGKMAEYLRRTRGLPSVAVRTQCYSNWLDNTKAKFLLGWCCGL